ncbi:MAG: hypothetical protein LBC82_01325 [Oscillospiraceae bacterium]|jgi:hypothetical protein|nr:hypothetical protein [Oscillospiraceae bacterium]
MKNQLTLIIYTVRNVITFDIKNTAENMRDEIAETLAEGEALILDTVEGSRLALNPDNVIAVEIKETKEETPPTS